jgi:proton-dependent oligopeptide transporter, POT family
MLPLMKAYIGQDIGVRSELASTWVSMFTGVLTVAMLFLGKPTEGSLGIRTTILLALGLALTGRILYASAPFTGGLVPLAIALVIVAVGEGILQPVVYAGVKQYTTEQNASMGYALLYAGLNLGAMVVGPISAHVRTTYDVAFVAKQSRLSGFNAVNVVAVVATAVALLVFALLMTKRAEAEKAHRTESETSGASSGEGGSPFKSPRFLVFIFALLPVRTLFAHQWLTMPEYVLRSYPSAVANRMEWLVESVNPLVVLVGVPMFTALTRRFHVLTIVTVGSLVSAASTFFLVFGTHTSELVAYFVLFSIGEALWASRFLEYAAELAPPGRVAQYMGVANIPWFVAQTTTGLYSGYLLERFVPPNGPSNREALWLIYGLVAMLSPVTLFLLGGWIRGGQLTKK